MSKILSGRWLLSLVAVGLLIGSWATSPNKAWAQDKDKVSVRLDWIPGAEHAFVYLAKEKGWYEEEGIDLEIVAGHGSTLSVKLVGNRENEFALSDGATLVAAWGRNVPLVSLAVIYHDTPTVVVFKAESGMSSLKDICGKNVGTMAKSTTYAQFKGMLAAANVDCEFKEIPVSPGGRELFSDVVSAQHHYDYLIAPIMELQGHKPALIKASDYIRLYSQSIITNEALIEEDPDLVRRFMNATMRGLRHLIDQPDEGLASFLAAHAEANEAYERRKLAVVIDILKNPGPHDEKLGEQSVEGWADSAKTLHDIKMTDSVVDTEGRFTNKFIE